MLHLFGISFILTGDVLLTRYLFHEKNKKLVCVLETMTFLRELTCLMYEFKLPLDEALKRQADNGGFFEALWEQIQQNPHQNIRSALTEAVQQLPFPEKETKNIVIEYLKNLGKSPKEQTTEHYEIVLKHLKMLYTAKKEEFHKSNKLSAGAIYGISLAVAILLW